MNRLHRESDSARCDTSCDSRRRDPAVPAVSPRRQVAGPGRLPRLGRRLLDALRAASLAAVALAGLTPQSAAAGEKPFPLPIFEAPALSVRPITGVQIVPRGRFGPSRPELGNFGAPMPRLAERARHLRDALEAVDTVSENRKLAAELLEPSVFGAYGEVHFTTLDEFAALPPRASKREQIDIQARVMIDGDLSAFRVGLGLLASPARGCFLCAKDERYWWFVVPHPSLPDWDTWEENALAWAAIPPEEIQGMLHEALRGAWSLMLDDLRNPRRESLGKRTYPEPNGARTRRLHVVHRVDGREWLQGDPFGVGQWSVYSMPVGWKPRMTRR